MYSQFCHHQYGHAHATIYPHPKTSIRFISFITLLNAACFAVLLPVCVKPNVGQASLSLSNLI